MYNDPNINIDWQFELDKLIISEKDQVLPNLANAKKVW
jgi:dTDP-4-dehydrorhamnose 3,5-epimerase